MPNLLEICNNVAIQLRFEPLVSIVGSTDKNAQFLYLAVNQGMRRDVFWYTPWAILRRQGGVAFSRNTDAYGLPTDFDHIVNDSAWDVERKLPANGPLDATQWAALNESREGASVPVVSFTIRGAGHDRSAASKEYEKFIYVYPKPAAASVGNAITYEYVSNQLVRASAAGGDPKTGFTLDTDIPVLDNDLVEHAGYVRALRMLGLGFADEMRELQQALKARARVDGGRTRIHMNAGHSSGLKANTPGYSRVRY